MAARKLIIAVTPGDPEGIGPEIVWKTLRLKKYPHREAALLCVGAREPFERMGAKIIESPVPPHEPKPHVWMLPAPRQAPKKNGKTLHLAGYQSGWAIETATRLVLDGLVDALATGPISKERLQNGGYLYPGHTEFLANLCGSRHVTMMLANETLRISLVTTHLALKDVPRALTREKIRRATLHTIEHLRNWWGIAKPRIAVAALNPHAGESGLFGKEEIQVIAPEIERLKKMSRGKYCIEGPLPADTLFANHIAMQPSLRYDAVICMYHDQGLVPVKLIDFPNTVNVTLGLPMIRTSVDHGVGFDIAGQNKADPSSFQAAVRMAIQIAKRTKKRGQR